MELKRTQKQIIGTLGEDIACKFLKDKRFEIITRNYRKKFGEIDIIAKKLLRIHFVEVKTVSRENLKEVIVKKVDGLGSKTDSKFVRPGNSVDNYRPEDNVHPWKLRRLSRAIQVYLAENKLGEETDWQFDVVTVLLDMKNKVAKVKFLENIIL